MFDSDISFVTLGTFSPKTEHRTEPKSRFFGFGFQFWEARCSASASVSRLNRTEAPRNRSLRSHGNPRNRSIRIHPLPANSLASPPAQRRPTKSIRADFIPSMHPPGTPHCHTPIHSFVTLDITIRHGGGGGFASARRRRSDELEQAAATASRGAK